MHYRSAGKGIFTQIQCTEKQVQVGSGGLPVFLFVSAGKNKVGLSSGEGNVEQPLDLRKIFFVRFLFADFCEVVL